MGTIGERLKNERERLKLTQEQLGAVGGVKRLAQANYEYDKRIPDANYLAEVAKVGVDILYVILGETANTPLNEEETLLLHKYRHADPAVRKFMLYGGESARIGQNFEGTVQKSQFISGDIHNNYHTSKNHNND